jgi:hypothetical protein
VEAAEPELTVSLGGGSEQTGKVIAVVRESFDVAACAASIRARSPGLEIDESLAASRLLIVSPGKPTRAEAFAMRLLAIDCVEAAEPELTVGLGEGGGEQTGRVVVIVREGVYPFICADRLLESHPTLEIEDVLDESRLILVAVPPPTAGEALAEQVAAIDCVLFAEPEITVGLGGGGGEQTGRVIAGVGEPSDLLACADQISASDETLQIEVLSLSRTLIISRR